MLISEMNNSEVGIAKLRKGESKIDVEFKIKKEGESKTGIVIVTPKANLGAGINVWVDNITKEGCTIHTRAVREDVEIMWVAF